MDSLMQQEKNLILEFEAQKQKDIQKEKNVYIENNQTIKQNIINNQFKNMNILQEQNMTIQCDIPNKQQQDEINNIKRNKSENNSLFLLDNDIEARQPSYFQEEIKDQIDKIETQNIMLAQRQRQFLMNLNQSVSEDCVNQTMQVKQSLKSCYPQIKEQRRALCQQTFFKKDNLPLIIDNLDSIHKGILYKYIDQNRQNSLKLAKEIIFQNEEVQDQLFMNSQNLQNNKEEHVSSKSKILDDSLSSSSIGPEELCSYVSDTNLNIKEFHPLKYLNKSNVKKINFILSESQ